MEKSFSLLLRLVTWWSAAVWLVCAAAPALPVSVIAAAPAEVEFSYEADPEDGRVFFSFPTVPGYHYMMEESQDMTSWTPTPGGSWYGDGGSKRMFIIQGSVPSPQLTGVPPPGPPAGYMWSLRGVTFRVSLAPGNGAQVHVRREPDASFPEWDAVVDLRLPRPTGGGRFLPLLTWEDESVMFWAGAAVTSPAALPADAVPHAGAHEEYEKAVFLALKDEMIARLTAPVAPPTLSAVSGPHRFLRFLRLRRTEADSTGRGIPVWWMLQYGLDPFDSSLTGSSTPFANGRTLAAAAAAGTTPAEPDHPAVAQITQWLSADFDRYNDSAGERAYGYSEEEEYWEDYEDGGPFSMTNPDEDWEGVMGRAGFGFSDIGSHTPSRSALFPFPVVSQTYADYIDLPASGSSSRQVVYIAGGTSARVKLATDGPRPFPVTRKFLRVLRDADTRGAAAQEWHYTGVPTGAEIVVPAEGSAGVLPELFVPNDRPALGGLEPNTEGIAQAWLQNVDFAADVNGNGGVDNQDGADGQSARYVVNYDFDGNRSIAEAPGVPIEDAIKWTALNASITAQGEPLRRLTPKYEEWSIAPGEDRRELTRLLLPVTPVLGPEVEVWLTMPKEETAEGRKHSAASRYETQAFHLYMGNPWLTGPSGKTVPLWGGVGVPGAVGTTVTVEEENVGGSGTVEYEVELAPEVEISKYVNPQAPGYLGDDPVAGSHTLVLEGILFKGMPLPGEDRLGTYRGDGETTGDDLFDGEIEIVVEYRRGATVLQSDSVKLRCFSGGAPRVQQSA